MHWLFNTFNMPIQWILSMNKQFCAHKLEINKASPQPPTPQTKREKMFCTMLCFQTTLCLLHCIIKLFWVSYLNYSIMFFLVSFSYFHLPLSPIILYSFVISFSSLPLSLSLSLSLFCLFLVAVFSFSFYLSFLFVYPVLPICVSLPFPLFFPVVQGFWFIPIPRYIIIIFFS